MVEDSGWAVSGNRITVVVFGIFVVSFERVRARPYHYGGICLT